MNYYEVNVSLNGRHFFATAERSAPSFKQAEQLFNSLVLRFPKKEGYRVIVTHWQTIGERRLSNEE